MFVPFLRKNYWTDLVETFSNVVDTSETRTSYILFKILAII